MYQSENTSNSAVVENSQQIRLLGWYWLPIDIHKCQVYVQLFVCALFLNGLPNYFCSYVPHDFWSASTMSSAHTQEFISSISKTVWILGYKLNSHRSTQRFIWISVVPPHRINDNCNYLTPVRGFVRFLFLVAALTHSGILSHGVRIMSGRFPKLGYYCSMVEAVVCLNYR